MSDDGQCLTHLTHLTHLTLTHPRSALGPFVGGQKEGEKRGKKERGDWGFE